MIGNRPYFPTDMDTNIHTLSTTELRVLGCLLEKEMATPEYYPLTLNALQNACNQKTNREPVVSYDEETVMAAVTDLKERKLVRQSNLGRAVKYEQILSEKQQLTPREKAIVCILLLRGPQTIGEIRGRTERLYAFNELDEVRETLETLMEMGFTARLPMQPGRKEARFGHLLGETSAVTTEDEAETSVPRPSATDANRIQEMEAQIEQLKADVAELRAEFGRFKAQFE